MRSTRYLSARRVEAPDAKVLNVVPVFAGEAMSGFNLSVRVKSLPSVGNAFSFIGPNGLLEYNAYILTVPWNVVATYSGGTDGRETAVPHPPRTTGEWDNLFRKLLLEYGSDGNEFYGANPDDSGTKFDTNKNIWVRQRATADAAADTTQDSSAGTDEPLTHGPMGVERLFSRETILTSDSLVTIGKSVSGLAAAFTQANINDLTYSDNFDVQDGGLYNGPGYVLFGIVRYTTDETEEFSAAYAADGATASNDLARNRALNMLFGGDLERVRWNIKMGTDETADIVRSFLFGGDNFLEDAGAYTPIDFFAAGSWFRNNAIVVGSKMFVGMESPYEMRGV